MQLPDSLLRDVTQTLGEILSTAVTIVNYTPASGGCINNGGRLSTTSGNFFIKWNDALRFPGMFEAEAKGLKKLAAPGVIAVPDVITTGRSGSHQFIVLQYIDQRSRSSSYWETFGQQLARLHQRSHGKFGLDHDNYIGSLRQLNGEHSSWIDFFCDERLQPQVHLALQSGSIHKNLANQIEQLLYKKLPELLIEEKPSLLHGDLWSGNLIVNEYGLPCLIDPAVYYGNREMDLAMTQLFGGFNSTFLDAYHEVFPLEPGFDERFELYNLYPLLVHVNLFGGGYASQVQSIVKRFLS